MCFCLSHPPLPPDHIPTPRATGSSRRRRRRRRKESYAVHETKSVKMNNIEKKITSMFFLQFVSFLSLPNTKWCFIFRLGKRSYAKHIGRGPGGDAERPAWVESFFLFFGNGNAEYFVIISLFLFLLWELFVVTWTWTFIFYYGSYYLLWLMRSVQNGDVEWMLLFGFIFYFYGCFHFCFVCLFVCFLVGLWDEFYYFL